MNDNGGRLANAHNRNQGRYKRVLCVCSAGMLRSPTIAWVLSNEPYNCNVRVVGAVPEYALVPVDEVLLWWAEEIVCADEEHKVAIKELLDAAAHTDKIIHVLHVPDHFKFRDPKLVAMIEKRLREIKFEGTSNA